MDRNLNFSFNPLGIDSLRFRLESLTGNVNAQERAQFGPRFRAAHHAWFGGGMHVDGSHLWDSNGFHPLFDIARRGGDRTRRNEMKHAMCDTVFDTVSLHDRALGALSILITIPHFQAECMVNVLPENIHADVYLPRHFVNANPDLHLPIANAVQSVIEGVGVPFIQHIRAAYESRRWTYGSDVVATPGFPPPPDRPLIPEPFGVSNKFRFFGYAANAEMTAPNVPTPDPTLTEDEGTESEHGLAIEDLHNELVETRAQLDMCQEQLVMQAAAITARDATIVYLQNENQLLSSARPSSASAVAGNFVHHASVSAPALSGILPSYAIDDLADRVASLDASSSKTTLETARCGRVAFEPVVKGFGMETVAVLQQFGFTDRQLEDVHARLHELSRNYAPDQWAIALCLEDGIGLSRASAVANAMLRDRKGKKAASSYA